MNIRYDEIKKDLPCDQLCRLFTLVGWCHGEVTPEQDENFNIGFINATLVVSAWEDDHLVGAVRVLSDKTFRSIIYDLLVDPEYQNQGIGKELVRRCIAHFPNSEWLVQTEEHIYNYYEKMGFTVNKDVFLTIPSKLF